MIAVLLLLMAGLVSGSIVCPEGTKCEDTNTCCPTKTGYACCQYPNAVCCTDKAHCCPQGYQCDVETQSCKEKKLPWYRIPPSPQIPAEKEEKRAPAPLVKSDNASLSVVHCDNIYVCPDSTTCCRSPFGQWYCCLYSVGQCCFDGIHCCPYGYHCDSTSTHCFRGEMSIPASPQIAAMERNTIQIPAEEKENRALVPLVKSDDPSVSVVHCDSNYVCPDSTTCCRSPFGRWYCCPYNVGQCCRDGIHCCPFTFRCDSTSTRCFRGELSIPASPQIAAMERNTIQIPAEEKENRAPASLVNSDDPSVSVVHCDSNYVCPDSTTCCRSPFGRWYCCPYNVGQCCRDGIHCCPFTFRCDSTSTRCFRGELSIPASPQIAAMERNTIQIPAEEKENRAPASLVNSDDPSVSVVHCDSNYVCPDSTTCCRSPFGRWYCCPYNVGQCCRDGIHCCPFTFTCDSTSTHCFRGELSIPASPQIAAMERNTIQIPAEEKENRAPASLVNSDDPSVSVVRCNFIYVCPGHTTCCRSPFGQWSCCIYLLGQCCRDGIHCCPFTFTCDSTSTICFRGELSIPASPQIAAMERNPIQIPEEEEQNRVPASLVKSDDPSVSVVHCDNIYVCPDSTTCCRSPFGQWYCCPYSVGQCCLDGIHCCPFTFHCDSTSTHCFRGELSIPASPQIAAMRKNTIQDQCCQSETGCCPIGFHCDEESKACVGDFNPSPLSKSALNLQNQAGVIHCSDRFYCPAGHSCCKTPTGQVACCPYALGTCCKDGKHCCEYGYYCNPTFNVCRRGHSSVPAHLTKEALLL